MLFALVFVLCFQFIVGIFPPHCGLILCDPPLCPNPIHKPEFCCPICPDGAPFPPPPPTLPTGPPPVVPPGGCEGVRCDVPCPNPIPPRDGECCPRCLEDCRIISCAIPICDVPTITPLGRCCPVCPSIPTISPPITGGSCPPDVPLVTCTNAATACEEEICPNFRNARCVFDNCGGCNTKFFVGQTEVTDRCGRVGERPPSATCPPNVPIVNCANAPTACEEATCPSFLNAQCIFDNCGGCDAKFFVGNREVTRRCGGTASAVSPPSPPSPPITRPPCPLDVPLVTCINAATACDEATCPNFPNARCIFDNCGDCHTKFFIGNRDVTDRCGATTPPTTPFPPTTGGSCPPDVPLVTCINAATACEEEICPNFRNASCVFDNCGGCNTKFFVAQTEVTDRCGRVGERPPSATCPPNVPIVNCANAPTACEEATCPSFLNAQCIFDNCGGCDAKFFVGNREVTRRCGGTASAVSPPSPPSPPITRPPCPPDVPLVTCINAATACDEATCPNFPNARCIFDNCGDCHTKFFIGNRDVTDRCESTSPPTQPPLLPPPCPPGVPLVNCLTDPCQTARCPNFPNARCVFDSCGGCNAKFFVGQREVTSRCTNRGSCPVDGQVFQQCRSCPATCSNPDVACAAVCIPGCGCPDGKLIDERNNKCVDREECSHEGGGTAVGHSCPIAGQVFQRCRSCPATCSNPNRICTLECRPGCGCPAGHVIDETNKRCIPLNECPTTSNICNLRPERGPCRGFIRRYYHNSLTGRCHSFIYGGCQGNENNFRSVQDCRRECRGQGGTSSSDICFLPRVTGPCRAAFRRYFYNSATKRCQPFVYGGCAGNRNNFRTLRECQSECNKQTPGLCQLPREPGPCLAYIPRWYYNSQRRQCERFIYGGCRGNDNNFSTQSECESVCHRGDPPNKPPVCTEVFCTGNPNHICTLPSDTPKTVPGRSHCDVTVCRACYQSLYPLPDPSLHRSCPQVIPLFSRNSSKCSSHDLIRQWGYCIQRAHRRAYRYLYGNHHHGGSFRCYRPPYPFYG